MWAEPVPAIPDAGEQLFHTGLLLGEELRLALWVGGRQLPGGLAAITCRMQQATRQYQLQVGAGPLGARTSSPLDACLIQRQLHAPFPTCMHMLQLPA